ncbi:MAG: hypothetical protein U0414_41605 [Polyangiaceae bacterium]
MMEATPLGGADAVAALERDARDVLGRRPLAADVAGHVEEALPRLGAQARRLAATVLARCASPASGRALLTLSGDADPSIARAAAEALLAVPTSALPDATFLVRSIAVRRDARVRTTLYRVLARTGDAMALPVLRSIYAQERDPRALAKAHVAAIRLGGVEERRAFVARLGDVRPRDALEAEEDLLDAGDPRLMRAAVTWFDDERVVRSVGTHDRSELVRLCDVAVRAASRLGISFQTRGRPPCLERIEPLILASARAAVLALPGDAEPLVAPPRAEVQPAQSPAAAVPAPPPAPPARSPLPVPSRGDAHGSFATAPPVPDLPPTAEMAMPPTPIAATPFVRQAGTTRPPPAAKKPRFNTGTQDLEQAKAAAMADIAIPFDRVAARTGPPPIAPSPPGPTRPPAEAAQAVASLSFDQYTWICALGAHDAALAQAAYRGAGLSDDAWRESHRRWQEWLGADAERWRRFQALLADYRARAR